MINLLNFYGLMTLDEAYDLWIDGRNNRGVYFGAFVDKLVGEGWLIQ